MTPSASACEKQHHHLNVLKLLYAGFEACFGWDPHHQTTGARVLVGTPATKPQAHVFWLGPQLLLVPGSDSEMNLKSS